MSVHQEPEVPSAAASVDTPVLEARWLGSVPYRRGLEIQEDLVGRRRDGDVPDQLLLLEHPHVITMGSSADPAHVLAGPELRRSLGIEMLETGRGGDVTYHGPGQLVGYPILDLRPDRKDIHRYLRDLEDVLIRVIDAFGVAGTRVPGRTGVWTGRGKIAAIGVRVSSRWITSHGFALNVNTEMEYYRTIIPCGIAEEGVTSLAEATGAPVRMEEVVALTRETFGDVFRRNVADRSGLP